MAYVDSDILKINDINPEFNIHGNVKIVGIINLDLVGDFYGNWSGKKFIGLTDKNELVICDHGHAEIFQGIF
jgi:hypothetical protein